MKVMDTIRNEITENMQTTEPAEEMESCCSGKTKNAQTRNLKI